MIMRLRGEKAAWLGMGVGFMLLMGDWIVKWEIEKWQAIRYAEEACKQRGLAGIGLFP